MLDIWAFTVFRLEANRLLAFFVVIILAFGVRSSGHLNLLAESKSRLENPQQGVGKAKIGVGSTGRNHAHVYSDIDHVE